MNNVIGNGRKRDQAVAFCDRSQPWMVGEEPIKFQLIPLEHLKMQPFIPHRDQLQNQEWACAARKRTVCVCWRFGADLIEFSINLPVNAESLGSGLQNFLFTSQPANMSPHAQSSTSLWCLLWAILRDSFWWMPQLSTCCSFHPVFCGCVVYWISCTHCWCCCHVLRTPCSGFLISFPPATPFEAIRAYVQMKSVSCTHTSIIFLH